MWHMDKFREVEQRVEPLLKEAGHYGVRTILSPIFNTSAELGRLSFLFLDMTDHAEIMFDRKVMLRGYLDVLTKRLAVLGSKRVQKGGGYSWLLKADSKPGEKIYL